MKNLWRALSLTAFVIGVVLFPYAHTQATDSQVQDKTPYYNDLEPAQPFVAKYVDSRVDSNGRVTVTGSRTRYVKTNGEWRDVMRHQSHPDVQSKESERVVIYAGTPDGVYEKRSDQSRRYVSEPANQQMLDSFRSPYYLRNNQEYVRTEQVAGLVVYVQRTEIKDPANQGYWTETSYSPKTGLNPLRRVIHSSDGSEVRSEALSVEFTEVPESLNDDIKSAPIRQKEKLKQN
jgi:hypothetical protein